MKALPYQMLYLKDITTKLKTGTLAKLATLFSRRKNVVARFIARPISQIRQIRQIRRISFIALLVLLIPFFLLISGVLKPGPAVAAPWPQNFSEWGKRKQLTLVNNSGTTLSAYTPYQLNVDTKALGLTGDIMGTCDDLRIVYQPSSTTATELNRSYALAQGATSCLDSGATIVTFPLQADITNSATDSNYYLYYSNNAASTYSASSSLSAYSMSPAVATFAAPFNGTTTALAAGSGTPTTATGAIRYSGAKSALSFDGGSDYVSAANAPVTTATNNITMEAWVNWNGTTGNNQAIINNGNTNSSGYAIYLVSGSSNQIHILNGGVGWATSTKTLNQGQWTHIAAVKDSGTWKLFVDGVSQTLTGNPTPNTPASATTIGSRQGGDLEFFKGLIDEVRVSNTARYTSNFTPQTSPFQRDSATKLLLHFDENGADPRNSAVAFDDSGNANHGTITGAKYVGGLVGVDDTSNQTNVSHQSYASHEGVFIEEGTTNKITNPSFENSTYSTNWATSSGVLNYDSSADTFTPSMSKRTPPAGPFAGSVMVQGKADGTGTPDLITFSKGNAIARIFGGGHGYFSQNIDLEQGSIVFWITPEWNGNDGVQRFFFDSGQIFSIYKTTGNKLRFDLYWGNYVEVDISSWTAGTTYNVVARWDRRNTFDGSKYLSLSINGSHTLGSTGINNNAYQVDLNSIGSYYGGTYPANALIQGLTIYRRPLYEATTPSGINVGNGDEISQIYNSGTGKDPTLVTGSWDVVFALPTNSTTGALTTGTGNAWSHPHSSNLLYTSTTNTGGFMMNGTYTTDGWSDVGTPTAVAALATANKIFAGGYYATSDAADEGIQRSFAATANANYVIRALGNSDGTCNPQILVTRADGSTEITHLNGTTTSTRTAPDVYIFTFQAPATENGIFKLINLAATGVCSWHQVEVQTNSDSNSSFENWSGTPAIPTGWGGSGYVTQENTTVHSGGSSVYWNSTAGMVNMEFEQAGQQAGKFYSRGTWAKVVSSNVPSYQFRTGGGGSGKRNDGSSTLTIELTGGNSWVFYKGIYVLVSGSYIEDGLIANNSGTTTAYYDDTYRFPLSDVSLTVTPASEANSAETSGLRVDGADTLTQTITQLGAKAGTVEFKLTPRHNYDVSDNFGTTTPVLAHIYGDSNDYIKLVKVSDTVLRVESQFNGTAVNSDTSVAPTLNAGTTYTVKITYAQGGTQKLYLDGVEKASATVGSSVAFSTVPATIYFGSSNSGTVQYDGTFDTAVVSGPTVTQNTTAPYMKFGVSSVSYVSSDPSNYVISISPGNTNSHTLSVYLYNGTAGAIGGTVDGTVASILWEGAVKTTTYTDMGGGWWRLTYSAATTNSANNYGVYVASGKTIYLDGVQLEEKAYATTYADGTLGTGYAWTGTANNSTSTRTGANLQYSTAANVSRTSGTVGMWVKMMNDTWPTQWAGMWEVRGTAWNQNSFYFLWSSGNGASSAFSFMIFDNNNNQYLVATNGLGAGKWMYLATTWGADDGKMHLYLNGAEVGTPVTPVLPVSLGSTLKIGLDNTTFPGIFSDLRIFDRALSSGQVSQIYYAGLGSHMEAAVVNRFASPEDPVAYYKLDEGTGTVAANSAPAIQTSGNNFSVPSYLNGTISSASWVTSDLCVSSNCLKFDGTDDVVTVANTPPASIQTVSFWVKPQTTTEQFIDLNGSAYISASSGTVSATGFTSPTYYINGKVTTSPTISANAWTHVEVTTATGISASAIKLGQISTNYGQIFLDEVKLFNYARTQAQILADYNAENTLKGGSASIGVSDQRLSAGLVGYWKMDESSGNAADSSGNSVTLTNNGTLTYTAGKFGNGANATVNTKYLSTTTAISGVKTVSFWINPTTTTTYPIDFNGTQTITVSGGTISANNFTGATIYVNGVTSSTLTSGSWQQVVITTNTSFNTGTMTVGLVGANTMNGTLDELRIYNRALSPSEVRQLYNFAPGPVGYWKFDDGSGTAVSDSSGNQNTGTWSGTGNHWTTGKFGKAGGFNGGNDLVTPASRVNLIYDGTFEAWIKTSSTGAYKSIVGGYINNNNSQYLLSITSSNKVECYVVDSVPGSAIVPVSSNSVTDGNWHHVACVRSGLNMYIYVDGILAGSGATSNLGFNQTVAAAYTIGGQHPSIGPFSGSIDDVKIYNYARTPDQIMEDMYGRTDAGVSLQGVTASGKGALIDLKMDEGNSTITKDSSGNGKNGTLNDGAAWSQNGKYGKGITLDGTNDDVSVPDFSY